MVKYISYKSFGIMIKRLIFTYMNKQQQKIIATGKQVATLKKGNLVTYLNPVAQERAEIMVKHYGYAPLIHDFFTLKPNSYYENWET